MTAKSPLERALRVVRTYETQRATVRRTLLEFLRDHLDELNDSERRKVCSFPSDLSDARLVKLITRVRNERATELRQPE